ncbi:MAG: hypothetical protein LQ343_000949 [Gyalolechia ehrenbergii]|nr:MAG: hypothetical protein LQ343_000949 [Gyalolechia ehrenbergii]
MQRRMLSKEDEATVGKDDLEVRREDQDKINKFSRLHQRETLLEDELKSRAVQVQELLTSASDKIEKSVSATEGKLSGIRNEMESLKVDLYARFGKSINLET